MDSESFKSKQNKVVEQLNKTTKRIQKARKNTKIAEKEAAEFEEIHKLLESTDDTGPGTPDHEIVPKEIKSSDCSIIPVTSPGLKVFHEELIFSLFKEGNCRLKSFINNEEKCLLFGKCESIPTEECFRKLIAYRVAENLIPEKESCSSISLYVLYLMSVHSDTNFVIACFDFLKLQKFHLRPEDIFPIFINFGAKREDLFDFCENNFLEKFFEEDVGGKLQKTEFPAFNMEMVGRCLLHYVTENLFLINPNIKSLIRGLAKLTLDHKIRSESLLPIYSTVLTILCAKIQKNFSLDEILSWVYFKEEHLLNQLEICRNISGAIFSDLHESLVLKILAQILKCEILPARPPIKINHLKSALKKLENREPSTLELYSLLQLINSTLPGLTATVKDSTEINALLASLEQKISKTEDSVDLIRLKLEIAKVGNMVTNNINNRFMMYETMNKSSVKKVKCSN